MSHDSISVDKLQVNPQNYRHEPQGSEKEAIEWLLENKFTHMKNLLEDIIFQHEILEHPLVSKSGKKYLVHDGNRRVTCLKILTGKVPKGLDKDLYHKICAVIPANYTPPANFEKVTCRVESDLKKIKKIIERRHIPGESGAGQVNWLNHQKESFYLDSEQYKKIGFSRKINDILIASGRFSAGEKIRLSIFKRLFNSAGNRSRVGFKVNEDKEIEFTKAQDKVLDVLAEIGRDDRTLPDLWSADKQSNYLKEFEGKPNFPGENDILPEPLLVKYEDIINGEIKFTPQTEKPTKKKKENFFPDYFPVLLRRTEHLSAKACRLYTEFNRNMNAKRHGISRNIVFRTLIEILTDSYIKKHSILTGDQFENSFLHIKISKVVEYILKQDSEAIDKHEKDAIDRFLTSTLLGSYKTLHKEVHTNTSMPPETLDILGDNLEKYFKIILTDLNTTE